LPVTFADFESFGIYRRIIGPGIREVCALGFVELTRAGRAGNGEFRNPNLFRMTYLPANGSPATNEWQRITTMEQAQAIALSARGSKPQRCPQRRASTPGQPRSQRTAEARWK
jgi:hypothetical protein